MARYDLGLELGTGSGLGLGYEKLLSSRSLSTSSLVIGRDIISLVIGRDIGWKVRFAFNGTLIVAIQPVTPFSTMRQHAMIMFVSMAHCGYETVRVKVRARIRVRIRIRGGVRG